ncbi:hypothetical protein [Streptomyces sp. NPDC049881]|uniref:hypothetical protein n=1 Tax=Streptomyces sp. NPDC049881 TaxID=3155778 RepID=UPI0034358F82
MRQFSSAERERLVAVLAGVPGADSLDFRRQLVALAAESVPGRPDVPESARQRDHLRAIVDTFLACPDQRAAIGALADALLITREYTGAHVRLRDEFAAIEATPVPEPPPSAGTSAVPGPRHAPQLPRDHRPVSAALGRKVTDLLTAVDAGRRPRRDVIADSGCGKSLLLQEINAGLQQRRHVVLFVTAQALESDPDTLEFLRSTQGACDRLISAMADDVVKAYDPAEGEPGRIDADFGREALDTLRAARGAVQRVFLAGDFEEARATLLYALDQAKWQVVEVLNTIARRHPLSVLVDDVHTVVTTPVGEWLAECLSLTEADTVVFARRPATRREEERARRVVGLLAMTPIRLTALTRDETATHVVHELRRAGWREDTAADCARMIFGATNGLPIGVVTCCEILTAGDVPPDAPPERVGAALLGGDERWDGPQGVGAIRTFIDSSVRRMLGRPAGAPVEIFDLLAVIRRCTPDLLVGVLAATGLDEQEARQVYDWLSARSFVTWFDDDAELGWRLHDFLRENVEARLRQDTLRYEELHRPVEAYYRDLINLDQERDTDSPYIVGARYEDPEWQRNSEEWMHHAAMLSARHFTPIRLTLIRLFLEAFWWWDTETSSVYSERLLASFHTLLDQLDGTPDQEWVTCLEEFHANYVPGQAMMGGEVRRDTWRAADRALARLGRMLDLQRDQVPDDDPLRRIHILLCCLRGDTAWYRTPRRAADRAAALGWLRAAEEACVREAELWMGNWAVWMQADLWLAVDPDPERAAALLPGLAERIDEQQDNELRVHLTRTLGDIAWHDGRKALAFDIWARAVLYGLVYNIEQEVPDQAPNEYSRSVYRGLCRHLRRRLAQAEAEGLTDLARTATERVRAFFAPYWEEVGETPSPDNPLGLPPEPRDEDLGKVTTDFAEDATWVLENMRVRDEPLDSPLTVQV